MLRSFWVLLSSKFGFRSFLSSANCVCYHQRGEEVQELQDDGCPGQDDQQGPEQPHHSDESQGESEQEESIEED